MELNYSLGSSTPKSFQAYPSSDFDLESGILKRSRKLKSSSFRPTKMLVSLGNRIKYYYKLHPFILCLISLSIGISILFILSFYERPHRMMSNFKRFGRDAETYPFPRLKNLVMVAGHSVYTSSKCDKIEEEDSWFLESYQKNPGQAATFVAHIRKGVEIAAGDDGALLLFSGGETRKGAGPRSEAQSYWTVAESTGWFGRKYKEGINLHQWSLFIHY